MKYILCIIICFYVTEAVQYSAEKAEMYERQKIKQQLYNKRYNLLHKVITDIKKDTTFIEVVQNNSLDLIWIKPYKHGKLHGIVQFLNFDYSIEKLEVYQQGELKRRLLFEDNRVKKEDIFFANDSAHKNIYEINEIARLDSLIFNKSAVYYYKPQKYISSVLTKSIASSTGWIATGEFCSFQYDSNEIEHKIVVTKTKDNKDTIIQKIFYENSKEIITIKYKNNIVIRIETRADVSHKQVQSKLPKEYTGKVYVLDVNKIVDTITYKNGKKKGGCLFW